MKSILYGHTKFEDDSVPLTLPLPTEGGSSRPRKAFSSITFEKHKLETQKFVESNFNNIQIERYNQTQDFLQNLAGERCKFGEVSKNVKIIGFSIFSETF